MGKPSVYHVPKFSKYLQLFFAYSLTELRIKFGLRPLEPATQYGHPAMVSPREITQTQRQTD